MTSVSVSVRNVSPCFTYAAPNTAGFRAAERIQSPKSIKFLSLNPHKAPARAGPAEHASGVPRCIARWSAPKPWGGARTRKSLSAFQLVMMPLCTTSHSFWSSDATGWLFRAEGAPWVAHLHSAAHQ